MPMMRCGEMGDATHLEAWDLSQYGITFNLLISEKIVQPLDKLFYTSPKKVLSFCAALTSNVGLFLQKTF